MTPSAYLNERNALLRRITRQLEADARVVAAWLFGSLGRGDADALGDIDLWVVIADDAIEAIVAHRRRYAAQVGEPVLTLEALQNAPLGGAYLMTAYDASSGPHIVDWYWQPRSLAFIPPQIQLLFDRAGLAAGDAPMSFVGGSPDPTLEAQPMHFISFFWMMWLITAKHVARTPHSESVPLLFYMLDPLCKTQRFLEFPEDPCYLSGVLPSLPSPQEKLDTLRRLADEMVALMKQVSAKGQAVPEAVVPGAYRYLDLVDVVVKI